MPLIKCRIHTSSLFQLSAQSLLREHQPEQQQRKEMSLEQRYSDDPLDHASREPGVQGINWDEASRVPNGTDRFVQFPHREYIAKCCLWTRNKGVVTQGQSEDLCLLNGSLNFEIQVYPPTDIKYKRMIRAGEKTMVHVNFSVDKYRESPTGTFKDVPQGMNVRVRCVVDQVIYRCSVGIDRHAFKDDDGWEKLPAYYVQVKSLQIEGRDMNTLFPVKSGC